MYIDVEDGFWGEQWWARMCPEDSSSNAGCCNTKSVTIENGEKFFWRGDNLGDCKDKDMQVNKLSVSKNIKLIESVHPIVKSLILDASSDRQRLAKQAEN